MFQRNRLGCQIFWGWRGRRESRSLAREFVLVHDVMGPAAIVRTNSARRFLEWLWSGYLDNQYIFHLDLSPNWEAGLWPVASVASRCSSYLGWEEVWSV